MKKLLALLMVVATLFCVAACNGNDTDPTTTTVKNDTATTTVANDEETTTVANNEETTTVDGEEETTTVDGEEETTTVAGEEETTTVAGETATTTKADEGKTTTTTKKPTTTEKPVPVVGKNGANINGVDPADANNQNKVVNGVFTSSNGGIQIKADGWKTYNLYSISMVPEKYAGAGNTNAVCVAVYPKGHDSYDSASVFENKTQADFEKTLQLPISVFNKTTITSNGNTYTCYKAVVTDAYYVWVFQTPEAKYFINFMQAPLDKGGYPFATGAWDMLSTIQIYK